MGIPTATTDLTGFEELNGEAHEMVQQWDVVFVAILPGKNNQWPTDEKTDKALEQMVENVRQGKISDYLAFGTAGDPLVLEGG